MIKARKGQKGAAMLFVLCILSVFMILLTVSHKYLLMSAKNIRLLDMQRTAEEYANAGLELAEHYIMSLSPDNNVEQKITAEFKQGKCSVEIKQVSQNEEFHAISVGICKGKEVNLDKTIIKSGGP